MIKEVVHGHDYKDKLNNKQLVYFFFLFFQDVYYYAPNSDG